VLSLDPVAWRGIVVDVVLNKPGRSARKAKGLGHLRRAEILEAAERIFLNYGYEGATIRRIADEVGVSSTALYMHFRDKSEILVEICQGAFAKLLAQNTEIAELQVDPVERVRLMLDAYMRFAFANPNAYQVVYCSTHPALTDGQVDSTRALSDRCYELFVGAVQRIADAGRLRGGVEESAQVTWTACHGLVALLIARPAFAWAERERLMALMLDGLLGGVVSG
jgi:AcrR family transcriptional regulator